MTASPHEILICTVSDGGKDHDPVCWGYVNAREHLLAIGCVSLRTVRIPDDLPRSRARVVADALRKPGWRYMLWWDDDVFPHDPLILARMHILADKEDLDVLGAPYPRKRIPIDIPYRVLPGTTHFVVEPAGAVEVAGVGIGFCLMSRRCLEAMSAHYRDELWATDDVQPEHEMICLFDPMFTPTTEHQGRRHRFKLSEDYSIQERWRNMGGKIHMYLEIGMKLGHAGRYTFTGTLDDVANPR